MTAKRLQLVFLLNLFSVALSWYSCPFNDGSLNKTIQNNITIQAECMYFTSPLEWNEFNPNTFDGLYYNSTKTISLTDLHMKRLYFSDLPPRNTSTIKHIINYWLLNGGGGSQYGMETFGVSMLKQIIQNKYHQTYPQTHPIIYLFQYRGAGLSKPSIHCYTAKTWIECARELIQTTVPSSVNDSLKIINAMTNQNIAQDLQYQIQYSINQSQSISPTSTYIYGLSQGTTIIQYYLSIQSINSHLQTIDGIILDGIMSIKRSDAFQNQIKSINNRFYLYLSKCQNDISCAKIFALVTGTDQDIITVTLTLQMLFLTNLTNPMCTTNLGLNNWNLFTLIASQSIELISVRPLAAILIARLYRCSIEDQRVLSRALPILIALIEKSLAPSLIDPPDVYPDDGNVLSITTVWSDFVGFTLEENFKTNITFFNDFCINSAATNEYYLASTGPMPVCREIEHWKYNYTIPSVFSEILYTKNARYWGQFQVNSQIFRSNTDGALLLNGDLDYNSPMYSAQQTQIWFQSENIPTKLIEMKGLTHVTSVQSYTKQGGFQSTTCTDQIVVQLLYQNELNLNLDTIDYTCSSKENLIGIDWLYSNPIVNQTLYTLFGNSTTNYWGINTTAQGLTERRTKLTANQPEKLYAERIYLRH
ncbi:unnamed protein product [Rotaria magnacalcarata]|uniref:Uncharacterized protein n=1 Tax=Rotaria magnacalcarata TaxID=392030 RepID=A0A816MFB2_9BILA|nr:unnamed protein product [Rotaria magnacalcarata]CAF4121999.1 unnamed protein product [Rotaria magnacalcarata]